MGEAVASALVFGGHSPIAMEISRKLSGAGPVIHVTRNIDQVLHDYFTNCPNVSLATWESFQNEELNINLEFLRKSDVKIESIVFSHRYRPTNGMSNEVEQFFVEVLFPYRLIMQLFENSLLVEKSSVVFVTSPGAQYALTDQPVIYHLTKASINQLVRVLSTKLSPQIKINAISPGSFVLKRRNAEFLACTTTWGKIVRNFLPLGQIPSTSDIADFVRFLVSEDNSLLNGQIIDLSGGYLNKEISQLLNGLVND